jgi:hypothetical protein
MTGDAHSYSLPGELEPDLNRVQAYWNGLKRGANDIPFWDDVKFSLRSRLGRESMLIDVFENQLRFRFDLMGADLTDWYGGTIGNRFLDEIDLHAPFDGLTLQCKATVEGCAPNYYRQTHSEKEIRSIRAATRASCFHCGAMVASRCCSVPLFSTRRRQRIRARHLAREDRSEQSASQPPRKQGGGCPRDGKVPSRD